MAGQAVSYLGLGASIPTGNGPTISSCSPCPSACKGTAHESEHRAPGCRNEPSAPSRSRYPSGTETKLWLHPPHCASPRAVHTAAPLKKKKKLATAPGKAEGSAAFVRLQAGPQPATCPSWAQGIALTQALQHRPQPPLLFVKRAAEPRDPRASSFSDQQGDDDRRNEVHLSQFSLT